MYCTLVLTDERDDPISFSLDISFRQGLKWLLFENFSVKQSMN